MIKANNHTCFEDRNSKKKYLKASSTDAVIY